MAQIFSCMPCHENILRQNTINYPHYWELYLLMALHPTLLLGCKQLRSIYVLRRYSWFNTPSLCYITSIISKGQRSMFIILQDWSRKKSNCVLKNCSNGPIWRPYVGVYCSSMTRHMWIHAKYMQIIFKIVMWTCVFLS